MPRSSSSTPAASSTQPSSSPSTPFSKLARHKTSGRAPQLIVAGCLVERYRDEIMKSIPEVDAVVGTGELEAILEAAGLSAPAPASLSPFNILSGSAAAVRPGQESNPAPTNLATSPLHSAPKATSANPRGRFNRDDWQGATHLLPTYLTTSPLPAF